MSEIASRFCTSAARGTLFRGLIDLRSQLRALGLQGRQWIDGSFCEDVESTRGRPPKDIDVVTLFLRPPSATSDADWALLCAPNAGLFDPAITKANFGCEAFYVDSGYPALWVADQITYWFGLFSHQRVSFLWKGMVEIELSADDSDDVAAAAAIAGMTFPP
jgi:hypothetical protein